MAIGRDIGADIDISKIGNNLRSDFKLFSESNTRWIIEVKKEKQKDFEKLLEKKNTPFLRIGETKGKKLVIKGTKTVIDVNVSVLHNSWKNAIWDIMG
jgi:phosphoribosylformylglycinamidine synthase